MEFDQLIEEKIRQAIAEGAFDNLEGKGKPLNLDVYFNAPEDVRAGYALLKSNNFVPEEVSLLKDIGILREKIKNCTDENEKRALNKELNEKSMALTIILERNKQKRMR